MIIINTLWGFTTIFIWALSYLFNIPQMSFYFKCTIINDILCNCYTSLYTRDLLFFSSFLRNIPISFSFSLTHILLSRETRREKRTYAGTKGKYQNIGANVFFLFSFRKFRHTFPFHVANRYSLLDFIIS